MSNNCIGVYKLEYKDKYSDLQKRDEYILNEVSLWMKNAVSEGGKFDKIIEKCKLYLSQKKIVSLKRIQARDMNYMKGGLSALSTIKSNLSEKDNELVFTISSDVIEKGSFFTLLFATDDHTEPGQYGVSDKIISSIYVPGKITIKDTEELTCHYVLSIKGIKRSGTTYDSSSGHGASYSMCYLPNKTIRNPSAFYYITTPGAKVDLGYKSYLLYSRALSPMEWYGDIINTLHTSSTQISGIDTYTDNCASKFRPINTIYKKIPDRFTNLYNYGLSTGRVNIHYPAPYEEPLPIDLKIRITKGGKIGEARYSLSKRHSVGRQLSNTPVPNMNYSNIAGISKELITHQEEAVPVFMNDCIFLFVSRYKGISISEVGSPNIKHITGETFPDLDFDSIGNLVYLDKYDVIYLSSGSKGIFKIRGLADYYLNGAPPVVTKINYPGIKIYAFDIDRDRRISVVTDTGIHLSRDEGATYTSSHYSTALPINIPYSSDNIALRNIVLIQTEFSKHGGAIHIRVENIPNTDDIILNLDFSVRIEKPFTGVYRRLNRNTVFLNPHISQVKGAIPFGKYLNVSGVFLLKSDDQAGLYPDGKWYSIHLDKTNMDYERGTRPNIERILPSGAMRKIGDRMAINVYESTAVIKGVTAKNMYIYRVDDNIHGEEITQVGYGHPKIATKTEIKNALINVSGYTTTVINYGQNTQYSKPIPKTMSPDMNLVYRKEDGTWFIADSVMHFIEKVDREYPGEIYPEIIQSLRFDSSRSTWSRDGEAEDALISRGTHKFKNATIRFECSDTEEFIAGEEFIGVLSDGVIRDGENEVVITSNSDRAIISSPITQSGAISKEIASGFNEQYFDMGTRLGSDSTLSCPEYARPLYLLMYKNKKTVCYHTELYRDHTYENKPISLSLKPLNTTYEDVFTLDSELLKKMDDTDTIHISHTLPSYSTKGIVPCCVLGDKNNKTGAYNESFLGICSRVINRDECTIDGDRVSRISYTTKVTLEIINNIEAGTMLIHTLRGVIFFSKADLGKQYSITYLYQTGDQYGLDKLDSDRSLEEILND